MTTYDAARLLRHVEKPWSENPKQPEDFSVGDSAQDIARCLDCQIPPECCNGTCPPGAPQEHRKPGYAANTELDMKVLELLRIGGCDTWICRELGLTQGQLEYRKKRLRKLGLR